LLQVRVSLEGVRQIQVQLGHRSPVVTLSVYTHLFEDAYDSVMARLDDDYRNLVRPKSGPNVVELPVEKPSQASDRGV
jgi:hypothetical protein